MGGARQMEDTAEAVGAGQLGRLTLEWCGGHGTEEDRLQVLRPESVPGRSAVGPVPWTFRMCRDCFF